MPADEFEIIAQYFAPLAQGEAARGLIDDVAVVSANGRIVLTTDTIIEGVHFLADDPLDLVARKALRVNVSDVVAKGASPTGVLLALAWPKTKPADEIARFAAGLKQDLEHYNIPLLGGDTTATPGPLVITITALGEPLGERVPSRADAQIGDDVWVTGVIGDAWLGLQARLGTLGAASDADVATLTKSYLLPDPPVAFAPGVAGFANASMDVSDGLLIDAEKMAHAAQARIALDLARVPLSEAAQRWLNQNQDRLLDLVSGGDDYQILFTAQPARRVEIESFAAQVGVRVTKIGQVEAGQGLRVLGPDGAALDSPPGGFRHQIGR